jgi:hypothetical protein
MLCKTSKTGGRLCGHTLTNVEMLNADFLFAATGQAPGLYLCGTVWCDWNLARRTTCCALLDTTKKQEI